MDNTAEQRNAAMDRRISPSSVIPLHEPEQLSEEDRPLNARGEAIERRKESGQRRRFGLLRDFYEAFAGDQEIP